MTYSRDLKDRIIRCIHMKKYTDTEIMNIFDIGRTQFYKWKNQSHKDNIRRKSKITTEAKKFIIDYVTKKINFNHTRLKKIISKKYGISISSSSIYSILNESKIKKKRFMEK